MNCSKMVEILVPIRPQPTRFDYKKTVASCGSAAFDGYGVIAPKGRYCPDHVGVAESDIKCPVCGVGGFKEYQLFDHFRIDCDY